MEDPKHVVKKEPQKGLFVLLGLGGFYALLGVIILVAAAGIGDSMADRGEGAGWAMIACGVLSIAFYFYGRRTRKP